MTKYNVHIATVASASIEVEAESGEEAVEKVFSGDIDLPFADAFAGYDLGEWSTGSELFPSAIKPEDDYSEVSE